MWPPWTQVQHETQVTVVTRGWLSSGHRAASGWPFLPQAQASQGVQSWISLSAAALPISRHEWKPPSCPSSQRGLCGEWLGGDLQQPLLCPHRRLHPEPISPPGLPVPLGPRRRGPAFLCACVFYNFSPFYFVIVMSLEQHGAGVQAELAVLWFKVPILITTGILFYFSPYLFHYSSHFI